MWNGGGGGFPFGGGYDDEGFAGGGMGARNAAAPTGAFTRQFRSYSVSFIQRQDLENSNRIVLPPSALDSLARLNISYPMLFQLESREGRKTHCGVLEFVAEEGHANIPYWVMQNLAVPEGGMVTIRNVSLSKGTYVKFQPQSSDFLDISNPKAVLEATLRNFTCLTKGDAIVISYNDKTYHIDVLEVAPGEAISIIEADVNVDFAPPPDYVDPSKPAEPEASAATGSAWRNSGSKVGEKKAEDPSERLKKRLERLKKPRGAALSDDSDDGDEGGAAEKRVGRDSDDSDSEEEAAKAALPKFPGSGQALKTSGAGSSALTFGGVGAGSGSASGGGNGGTALGGENSKDAGVEGADDDLSKARAARARKFQAFSGAGVRSYALGIPACHSSVQYVSVSM